MLYSHHLNIIAQSALPFSSGQKTHLDLPNLIDWRLIIQEGRNKGKEEKMVVEKKRSKEESILFKN